MADTPGGDGPAYSLDQVRAAFEEACPSVPIRSLRDATAGYTSRQWLVDTDEGPLLLKVPVRNTDPEHMRHMIAATRRAADAGVPVVRYRAFLPSCEATGSPVVVQEWVEGVRASDVWDDLPEDARRSVISDLGRLVAVLHGSAGNEFGDVLGARAFAGWAAYLEDAFLPLLTAAPEDIIPEGRAVLEKAMVASIEAVDGDGRPVLTHGDLWLENVLVRDGSVHRLLDFEHARFLDAPFDFCKPDELVFEAWPAGRAPFLEAYASVRPLGPDFEQRLGVYRGLHYLFMYTWFARWAPVWVPEYSRRLAAWVRDEAVVG